MTDSEGAGTGAAGEQTPSGAGAAPAPAAAATAAQGTAQGNGSGQQPGAGEQTVPYARFKQIIDERDALAKAAKERDDATAKEQGKWQELATKREQERDSLASRFVASAKRSAFVSAIAPQVADAKAAYILARDSGLLDSIEVDDDGEPKDAKAVEAAVKQTIERFKFLKVDSRSFGQERGGVGGSPAPNTDKMGARELMALGYGRGQK